MKAAFITLGFFGLVTFGMANSFACSMETDQNYTKNLLMAHGVSGAGLSLSKVTSLKVEDYGESYSGGTGRGSCPDYVTFSGKVSMNHTSSALKDCKYSSVVTIKAYIGNDLPTGPMEDISISEQEATCTTFKLLKKPVIVRPFPR